MATTKVFKSGNSQAVRIPKEFQIDGDEVEILKVGNDLILRTPRKSLLAAYEALQRMSPDFFEGGRKQPKLQKRKGL